ncbi:nicotinamide riboside transporter PnuC [Ornithinimicrobium avium]|uniref:Nicotinamide riboside transporter PnuC n=1 Tax=Ornithinimicrobium avium TaxID=2283195 RepID=A0A345NJ92_9MICO|nr:nicotinamide riboside transporter PnuC [Ornithinimicrobium avium]AXH95100.1 nicotinamide riboside transporter PnuC [Ornithinimicrobium avium]
MDVWNDIFNAQLQLGQHTVLWREVVGNAFGLASAILGMRRKVWAWPVGIVGNLLLVTVFMGVWFANPQEHSLFGQAARQVFFMITSVYGWWVWNRSLRGRAKGSPAITPRWATGRERGIYLVAAAGLVVLSQWVFRQVGVGWPAPSWYYWTDAWIFVGSMLATYAMARGWVDFWLVWIAVDLVGVPLLWSSGYYPSAVMYIIYGGFVIWGFFVWKRAARVEAPTGQGPNLAEDRTLVG